MGILGKLGGSFIVQVFYISPGVTIGRNCLIGLYSYLRRGRVVPDGAKVVSVGGVPPRTAQRLQRAGGR